MSFASQFAAGASIAKGLTDTYEQARMRDEIKKIGEAKPENQQGFTTEQGAELEAAAKRGDAVDFDQASGSYVVTPAMPDGQAGPAQSQTIAQQGTTDFLGKRVTQMNDDQVSGARYKAFADVIGKFNPEAGLRMQREAKRDQRDDERYTLEKSRNEREERKGAEQEKEDAYGKQLNAEVGEAFQARLKNPDGTARAATVDDHLAASQLRITKLTQAGHIDKAGAVLKDYQSQAFAKIQLQTAERDQALGKVSAAMAAGDLDAVKDYYNEFIPDGSTVTGITRGQNGQIVIQRQSLDGQAMPETVLKDVNQLSASLASFKDPMAVYNWSQNEFKNNQALRADARADKSLALQGANAAESRANREFQRGEAAKKASAGVNLFKENNPNATPAELAAVSYGVIPAAPENGKNAPSEVKLARAMVDAGLAPDMKTGIEMAVTRKSQSPSETHKDFVTASLKEAGARPEEAVKNADAVMEGMGYVKKGNRWAEPERAATKQEFEKLPSGARFTAPDGTIRTKR